MQTIPGLALLALMVPLLGQIGFLPAFIALVLYSMLPILHNTVTGILGVDRVGHGGGAWHRHDDISAVVKVELPLAAPVIIAGIRTSTVWVVGTATLATPVGATSLGNYIFSGLQTQNPTAVIVGCLAAAALAMTLDQLIASWKALPVGKPPRRNGCSGRLAFAPYRPDCAIDIQERARPRPAPWLPSLLEPKHSPSNMCWQSS